MDWSSSFILKASLHVLFFGMERHTLFETVLDFTESLSIGCCKVFSKHSREMFSSGRASTPSLMC